MRLRAEIINFIGSDLINQFSDTGRIREIPVVNRNPRVLDMRTAVDVADAGGIESGCAPDNAMHLILLLKKHFCQIRSILSRDARDERFLLFGHSPMILN